MTYGLSPLVVLLLASIFMLIAGWRRWRRLRIAACVLALLAWAAMTPLVANRLVGLIETRADEGTEQCHDLDAVVLLTGGFSRPPQHRDDWQSLNVDTVLRATAFVERDNPSLPLYLAGGGWWDVPESEVLRAFLARIAPTRAVTQLDTSSRDTWGNAEQIAILLPPPRRIALATSALHLPRARLAFEDAGFTVCPWPLNRAYVRAIGPWSLLPQTSSANKTERVMHEALGTLLYAWRSRDR